MDNFLLQAIVTELESLLTGARLGKVYQIGTTDLALDFRLRDGRWLLVSTDPQRLALYLTTRNPKQLDGELRADTPFVSLAKKHLGGARVVGIEKLGYDRVVHFDFEAEDETGQPVRRTLVVMLTGRAANVLVIQTEGEQMQVVASLREREDQTYIEPSPPANKLDPFQVSAEKLDELIAANNGDVAAAARQSLIGFSPLYADELRARSATEPAHEALQRLLADLFESPPQPAIYSSPPLDELQREIGRDEFQAVLFVVPPSGGSALRKNPPPEGGTTNALADQYFTLLDERRQFFAQRQKLQSQLASRLKKQRALLANLNRELAGFAQAETHQRYGELLLANLHQAVKTDAGFEVTDFYDERQPAIIIPSANKAGAKEAAEHYFKLARKSRHGQQTINQRLPEIEREIAALDRQLAQLGVITRAAELSAFADSVNLPQPQQPKKTAQLGKKAREEKLPGVRRYRSSDGFEILVGRADRDNDYLTFRIAKSHDLWLHAADYPGSHVVVRNPQRKPLPPRAITEAAQLAAKFSQARTNAKVAVNYCERKFVTKMKGFAPGQVRLSSFKTVLVEPAEAGERI
ncbi:MAG: Rqc2 family fibronectin-binding protein [Blastocatellia bacterium]